MGSCSVTCHPTQVNTSCVNTSLLTPARQAGTRFTYPGGMEGWVDLTLVTYPQTVTHPSTNRTQCRLSTLIKANALTATLCRHPKLSLLLYCYYMFCATIYARGGLVTDSTATDTYAAQWLSHFIYCIYYIVHKERNSANYCHSGPSLVLLLLSYTSALSLVCE